ncbi:MAG: hypothetical protein C5B53_05475 [Candidatus Melainabacteria bacterium]|nr:MAG: hypothetical protein C5B53_05475 [Candidatus Melainabacteria bacterium]
MSLTEIAKSKLPDTGERYVPGLEGAIELEHLHRYAIASTLCQDKDVLDIACGEGYGCHILARTAKSVTGVDLDSETIAYARLNYKASNVKFLLGACQDIPVPDRSFDVVVSFETLEHIVEHDEFMSEIKRVLRENGLLIISTPDKLIYSDISNYKNPFHVRELYEDDFRAWLKKNFKFVETLRQQVLAGSFLFNKGQTDKRRFLFFEKNERQLRQLEKIDKGSYMLALASEQTLPALDESILVNPTCLPNLDRELVEAAKHNADANQLMQELDQARSDAVDALCKKEGIAYRLRKERDQLERQVLSQTTEVEKLQRKLNQSRNLIEDRDERIGALNNALQVQQSTNSKLNVALNNLRETEALLNAYNAWRTFAVAALATGSRSRRLFKACASMAKNARLILRSAKNLRFSLIEELRLVRKSGLFDTEFYSNRYPDVMASGVSPLLHYLTDGAREGRDPNPLFSTSYYLAQYDEVVSSNMNPLVHYLVRGWHENLDPNPLFNTAFYKAANPSASIEPLSHYASEGWRLGYNPHPFFDTSYYLKTYPDIQRNGINPLAHYLLVGAREGKNPHPLFDSAYYLKSINQPMTVRYPLEKSNLPAFYHHARLLSEKHPEGINPLEHYLGAGALEGRNPHPLFDTTFYLNRYPEVKASGINPLVDFLAQPASVRRQTHPLFDPTFYLDNYPDVLDSGKNPLLHFLRYGAMEERDPNPSFDSSYYLDLYEDVRRSGQNPLVHYVLHGAAENRKTHWQQSAGEQEVASSAITQDECRSDTLPNGQESGESTNSETDLIPPASLDFVGNGSFKEIGEQFKSIFIEHAGLKPHERVLDVGCGIGRMALPLTKYLDHSGEYVGFDIVKVGIDWCEQNITPRYPNFKFQLLDIYNRSYNPVGTLSAESCKFPYESNYFDFIFLTSVFTHMLPEAMENYLSEIARVLKPEGRCLITYFLLNRDSRALMLTGTPAFQFGSANVPYALASEESPEFAIAFDEDRVRQLYDKFSIELIEPVHYGNWCGRTNFLSFQDIVVARKKSESTLSSAATVL